MRLGSGAATGHDVAMARDLAWAVIYEVADRLNRGVGDLRHLIELYGREM